MPQKTNRLIVKKKRKKKKRAVFPKQFITLSLMLVTLVAPSPFCKEKELFICGKVD